MQKEAAARPKPTVPEYVNAEGPARTLAYVNLCDLAHQGLATGDDFKRNGFVVPDALKAKLGVE
jgi:hypothetical protein